jgi:hypothetical protein
MSQNKTVIFIKDLTGGWGGSSVVERLPSMCKALGSMSYTTKKKEKKKKRIREQEVGMYVAHW